MDGAGGAGCIECMPAGMGPAVLGCDQGCLRAAVLQEAPVGHCALSLQPLNTSKQCSCVFPIPSALPQGIAETPWPTQQPAHRVGALSEPVGALHISDVSRHVFQGQL